MTYRVAKRCEVQATLFLEQARHLVPKAERPKIIVILLKIKYLSLSFIVNHRGTHLTGFLRCAVNSFALDARLGHWHHGSCEDLGLGPVLRIRDIFGTDPDPRIRTSD
jgi:hypothetical protein